MESRRIVPAKNTSVYFVHPMMTVFELIVIICCCVYQVLVCSNTETSQRFVLKQVEGEGKAFGVRKVGESSNM